MRCSHVTVNRVETRFPKETEVTNRETVSREVFILSLELLTRRMLENPFPDGNKDHLLNQARSELVKQEHQVGSINHCIDKLQQQAFLEDWNYRTHHTDISNLDESKFDCRKNYL